MLPQCEGAVLFESIAVCPWRKKQQPRIGARLRLRVPALQGTDAAVPVLYTIRSRCTYDIHSLKTLLAAECYESLSSLHHQSVAWQQNRKMSDTSGNNHSQSLASKVVAELELLIASCWGDEAYLRVKVRGVA
jgi:hypothetical protein